MSEKIWRLSALDTLFFRESRPMESIGGAELSSVFPPPARTLAGAIRTTIAESIEIEEGMDWKEYAGNEQHPMRQSIGYGDDLGPLSMKGPWITYGEDRLYPAPSHLAGVKVETEFENRKGVSVASLGFMQLSTPCHCDLGENVRFASLPANASDDVKSLSGEFWLTFKGLSSVLKGVLPKVDQIIHQDELYVDEARIGIGRDNQLRSVKEGLLYQTRHIRLKNNVCIEVDVQGGPDSSVIKPSLLKLGGEGRMADVNILEHKSAMPSVSEVKNNTHGLMIYLLTPALITESGGSWSIFDETEKKEEAGLTTWSGKIHGVNLILHSAVVGTAHREGGWDMAKGKPRTVKSLIPAGTAFYCTVNDGEIEQAIKKLNGSQVGEEQSLGRGQIAVGLWLKDHQNK